MATCMLCKQKIHFLVEPCPLSKEHYNIKICVKCNERKRELLSNCSAKNELFEEQLTFFEDLLSSNTIADSVVEEALLSILNGLDGNLQKTHELIEQRKREQKELEEAEQIAKEKEEALKQEVIELLQKNRDNFIVTTGNNVEGYRITKYRDVVSGEVVLGSSIFSELSAQLNDLFGTNSTTFSRKIKTAKKLAQNEMTENALLLGANAIIGVDFDILTLANDMIAVSANGTAVTIEEV